MSELAKAFDHGKAFIAFVTCGDPDLETTGKVVRSMVENGADLRVVQEMLGHESILTTEIYTHIDSATWQKAVLEHHPRRG